MKMKHAVAYVLFSSIIVLPAYSIAADNQGNQNNQSSQSNQSNQSSKLNNQSGQNGAKAFYLVQERILGEGDCAQVVGNKRINPGESAQLNIKKDCSWGVVRYKIFSVQDNKQMGYLGHAFHDGNFNIDITSQCNGSECNFFDLNPDQDRKK